MYEGKKEKELMWRRTGFVLGVSNPGADSRRSRFSRGVTALVDFEHLPRC